MSLESIHSRFKVLNGRAESLKPEYVKLLGDLKRVSLKAGSGLGSGSGSGSNPSPKTDMDSESPESRSTLSEIRRKYHAIMRLEETSATESTRLPETFEMPILALWEQTAQLLGQAVGNGVDGTGTESGSGGDRESSEEIKLKTRIESFLER
jgi:hypothetical protein